MKLSLPRWLDPADRTVRRLGAQAAEIVERSRAHARIGDDGLVSLARSRENARSTAERLALAVEAVRRGIGVEPHLEQVMAALAMHERVVAEVRTGEGKTIVGCLAAASLAIADRRVHLVPPNPYLAARDWEIARPALNLLGVTSGAVRAHMSDLEKRRTYLCAVVYVDHQELGFDFLRDQRKIRPVNRVLPVPDVALIDEADAILIDDALTPFRLAIGGEGNEESWHALARCVERLSVDRDFEIDFDGRSAWFTESGTARVEEELRTAGILEEQSRLYEQVGLAARMHLTLHAHTLLRREHDYIVEGGKIIALDSGTGRPMPQRKWMDGLQEAVESKERVPVSPATDTVAICQNSRFYGRYPLLAGMTGTTADTDEEFTELYELKVVRIPPVRQSVRIDEPDRIFPDDRTRRIALATEALGSVERGQPVLIGTDSEEAASVIASELREQGAKVELLSAKNPRSEAEIIARAGEKRALTVATRLAGRGTDVKIVSEVERLGGLRVLSYGRLESRRLDDQLKGRTGRQGGMGSTVAFVSLDDPMIRANAPDAASEKIDAWKGRAEQIKDPGAAKLVDACQARATRMARGRRISAMRIESAFDDQRQAIYRARAEVADYADDRGGSTPHAMGTDWEARIVGAVKNMVRIHVTKQSRRGSSPSLRGAGIRPRILERRVEGITGVRVDLGRLGEKDAESAAQALCHEIPRRLRAQRRRMMAFVRRAAEALEHPASPCQELATTTIAALQVEIPGSLADVGLGEMLCGRIAARHRPGPLLGLRFFRLSYLARLDRAWSRYLTEVGEIQGNAGLASMGARSPEALLRQQLLLPFEALWDRIAIQVLRDLVLAMPSTTEQVAGWERLTSEQTSGRFPWEEEKL